MGMYYSRDLRERVAEAVSDGMSRRAAARRFGVSDRTSIRWADRAAKEGAPNLRRQGRPRGKGPLSDHLNFLIAAAEAKPDMTLEELAALLLSVHGVRAHSASISRLLCRAGFTYKKTADGPRMRARRRRPAAKDVD
jgi:transposase